VSEKNLAAYDEIYCGEGRDFVEASGIDYVAPDCETVKRYQRALAGRRRAEAHSSALRLPRVHGGCRLGVERL
jgi:hypothetical protein